VRSWACLLLLIAGVACSGLEEGEGGVVGLEIEFPEARTLEVGEQVQLTARALDVEGQPLDVAISWRASNPAVTSVDGTGLVTALAAGTADVQAVVGSLGSERVGFTVVLRPDTIIIEGDSVLTVPFSTDPAATATLPVRLETFDPPGPVGTRPVIFEIVQPLAGETPVVQISDGVQTDTVNTSTDGLASVVLAVVSGQVPPDTAIVEVRANRTRGDPVPGSGQRFIVLFE
jgi:Bacterial Ig-like domain (group 2)